MAIRVVDRDQRGRITLDWIRTEVLVVSALFLDEMYAGWIEERRGGNFTCMV